MSEGRETATASVVVERFAAGGEGLARHADGRVVFVRGGLPGDHLEVRITDDRRQWLRGEVIGVDVAGPDRIVANCASRIAGCGGCDWGEVADSTQLEHKQAVVTEALRRTARIDAVPELGRSVSRTGYRSSIRVIGDREGTPAFRRGASDATVAGLGCEVAVEGLRDALAELHITPGLEVALRSSVSSGELTARWDHRAGSVAGLPPSAAVGDNARITERITGVDLMVSAASFFQSGPQAATLLVESIEAIAPEVVSADHLVDAYGGVGLFAATLGRSAGMVTMVESSRSAVADATVNLAPFGDRVSVVRSDVSNWRPDPTAPPVDVVIADPARTGLGRPGVGALVRCRPQVLVLVSCDPVAMARDVALLAAAGYGLEHAVVHDLFPGTHHVEVVSRFVLAGTIRT